MEHNAQTVRDALEAGTGFMVQPAEALLALERSGYLANLVPRFDHFEASSGALKLYPADFRVDEMMRFENTSDPDDQSILYAITAEKFHLRGIYLESYGLYTEDLSQGMLARLKDHNHNRSPGAAASV